MVKHTQTTRRNVFDHFERLALKGLKLKMELFLNVVKGVWMQLAER